MPAPNHSITLSPEQVGELSTGFSELRHNVNNWLSLIVAATDLMRHRPDQAERFLQSLTDPPQRITQEISKFSELFEKILEIPRR